MPITAADVHATQFRVVFRGYDIRSVDAFLDEVERELEHLGAPGSAATDCSDGLQAARSSEGLGTAESRHAASDREDGVAHARGAALATAVARPRAVVDDVPPGGQADDPAVPAGSGGVDGRAVPAGSGGVDGRAVPAGSGGVDGRAVPAGSGWADDRAVPAGTGGVDVPARAMRTLRLAEQMADQVVASAVAEADQIQAEAADVVARLSAEARELEAEVERLRALEVQIRERVESLLHAQLELVRGGGR